MNYIDRLKLFRQLITQISKELGIIIKDSTHYRKPDLYDEKSQRYVGELEYDDNLKEYFVKNMK